MLKKMYLFVYNHMIGFIRFWLALIFICVVVVDQKFHTAIITANTTIWMLLLYGEHKKWYLEETKHE